MLRRLLQIADNLGFQPVINLDALPLCSIPDTSVRLSVCMFVAAANSYSVCKRCLLHVHSLTNCIAGSRLHLLTVKVMKTARRRAIVIFKHFFVI